MVPMNADGRKEKVKIVNAIPFSFVLSSSAFIGVICGQILFSSICFRGS